MILLKHTTVPQRLYILKTSLVSANTHYILRITDASNRYWDFKVVDLLDRGAYLKFSISLPAGMPKGEKNFKLYQNPNQTKDTDTLTASNTGLMRIGEYLPDSSELDTKKTYTIHER